MKITVIQPTAKSFLKKLKVGAYARVSTDSSEQEDSLENQKAYFKDYIQSNPEWEFVGVYADQGISGYKESRPRFQEMIQDARDGKIDLIVVKSVSRFARNTETVLKFSRELKSIGVGIFFQLQNINTLTCAGELMLTILAAFAQAESEDASENTKLTVRRKFEKGIPVSGIERTYGYCSLEDGTIAVNEEEARTVRFMFDLAARGVWQSKIRQALNDRGIPAPESDTWDDRAVSRILHNVSYKGDLVLQKTWLDTQRKRHKNEGQASQWYITEDHPAIIDPEQWDAVQEILAERSEAYSKKPQPKPHSSNSHSSFPLSGKLYCPRCGSHLIHKWSNGGKSEYWACRKNLKEGSAACRGIWLPAAVANSWGKVEEDLTVLTGKDENGMAFFTAYPKVEFEQSEDCLYLKEA